MKTWLATGFLLALLPLSADAQQIPVKTVPVATGDQFLLFPSQNMGMGGVSIALDDPLYDPFENPAKGVLIQGVRFAGAPVYYNVAMEDGFSNDVSSGRTLPVGVLLHQGGLFGGAVLAWQELSQETQDVCCFGAVDDVAVADFIRPDRRSTSTNNLYAFGMVGAQVPGTTLSVGASAFVAGLNGLEGVRLLYFDGDRVEQSGGMSAFRAGLYQQWADGRSAGLVVLHHRFDMAHEMPRWDETQQQLVLHTEHDETLGWAAQATLQQPLGDGWRLGGRLAGDWKRHPKIPNYDVMQIPRDPGHSSAYNVGFGLARSVGQATFGFDLIYEPIWSHTWADALVDTPTTGSEPPRVIRADEMTVENFFRFDNTRARLGVRRAGDRFDFALGLDVHTFRYDLDQENFVEQFERTLDESWSEWTGTLGLGLTFAEFQVRYLGLLTLGTGRPGVAFPARAFDEALSAADFVIAPGGPLTLQDARVWTHQVTILIPIVE